MLDIFRDEPSGMKWLGTASDLQHAKEIVKDLFASEPGEYFAVDLVAQTKHRISPQDTGDC